MSKSIDTIFLLGYMGAGKTVIGRSLSKKLDFKFYDLVLIILLSIFSRIDLYFSFLNYGRNRYFQNFIYDVPIKILGIIIIAFFIYQYQNHYFIFILLSSIIFSICLKYNHLKSCFIDKLCDKNFSIYSLDGILIGFTSLGTFFVLNFERLIISSDDNVDYLKFIILSISFITFSHSFYANVNQKIIEKTVNTHTGFTFDFLLKIILGTFTLIMTLIGISIFNLEIPFDQIIIIFVLFLSMCFGVKPFFILVGEKKYKYIFVSQFFAFCICGSLIIISPVNFQIQSYIILKVVFFTLETVCLLLACKNIRNT